MLYDSGRECSKILPRTHSVDTRDWSHDKGKPHFLLSRINHQVPQIPHTLPNPDKMVLSLITSYPKESLFHPVLRLRWRAPDCIQISTFQFPHYTISDHIFKPLIIHLPDLEIEILLEGIIYKGAITATHDERLQNLSTSYPDPSSESFQLWLFDDCFEIS